MLLNKRLVLIFSTVVITIQMFGQNCDCNSSFAWIKKTFEENDAGFQYIIDKKGMRAYDIHNQLFESNIKLVKDNYECAKMFGEWLQFFRKGHIGIAILKNDIAENQQEVTKSFPDRKKINIDTIAFKDYLNSKKDSDFEGIWQIGVYTIGIKQIDNQFIGFIINSEVKEWLAGEIKLTITSAGNDIKSVYYMRNHDAEENINRVKMLGNNVLQIGNVLLKRIFPRLSEDRQPELYFQILNAQNPFLEQMDKNTLLMRVPSFDFIFKHQIDSILHVNRDEILSAKNLIIDLRDNGGGSDDSFNELIPYLYTNPIRTVGVEYLSTPQNNKRMLDFTNDTIAGFSEQFKNWARESYEVLEKNIGRFVGLSSAISIHQMDTIYKYPQNVGIIINDGCASSTEQFLLAAKQSKKVKLFGKKTSGALDVSNIYYTDSPCEEFRLYYTLTKSYRIPDMAIDDVGIQPDYFIDDEIPEYKWVEFVNEILKAK